MSLHEHDDDVLQIDINCDEMMLGEELIEINPSESSESIVSSHSNGVGCCNSSILLKVIRKGMLPVDKYREGILKHFIDSVKLNIIGFYFNDSSSALVEVEIDNSLKSYLVSIYEDRLGRKLLNGKSVDNIIEICDGKFPLLIENSFLFMLVIPNMKFINLPCKSSHALYGLHNGNMCNLLLGKFEDIDRINMFDLYAVVHKIFSQKLCHVVGLKYQSCVVDSSSFCARILVNILGLSERILCDLHNTFGITIFSSDTLHAFSMKDADEIQNKFFSVSASESVALLGNMDLFSTELNGFSKARKIKINKSLSNANDTNTNTAHGYKKNSIFSRLGGKISETEPSLD